MELWQRVGKVMTARRLVARGGALLVAVSGGADSMVLLAVVQRLTEQNAWRLGVAHFNHRLRGAESDADAALVRSVAEQQGLPLFEESWRHEEDSRVGRHGKEMAARLARHEFLARAAAQFGGHTVALAHHADDQAELFFLRLFRGSGGEGLGGMAWANASPVAAGVRLVRPLLSETRAELRAFAAQHGIAFREDASNADRAHDRNRIRHELLPLLAREFEPAIAAVVGRAMEIVGADAEFARAAGEKWLVARRRAAFAKLPTALQRQVVRLQLRALGVEAEFDLIEQLRGCADTPVTVRADVAVWRDAAGVVAAGPVRAPEFDRAEAAFELRGDSGELRFSRLLIAWNLVAHAGARLASPRVSHCEFFDADKVGPRILLRHWRAGDRFQPIGMAGPVKLQDLFAAARVARARRHELSVAATAAGVVFWVEGLRMSEQFKLDSKTVRRLKWQWVRP